MASNPFSSDFSAAFGAGISNTSNIHIGLPAWVASHAYAVGARISNGGPAYQCITAGTSAAASGPTGTGSDIIDGSVHWKWLSTIDYTSLSAWAASIPATLTQPIVGLLWNDAPITTTAGTAFLTLSSHTTSTTNTITLKPAPGEGFRDKLAASQSTPLAFNTSNGVAFVLPSGVGGINYFNITDANVILDGLQFQDPFATSNCTIIQSTGANTIIKDCIIDGYAQAGGSYILAIPLAATGSKILNTLIIDRQATSGTNEAVYAGGSQSIVNLTLFNPNANTAGHGIIANQTDSSITTVRNCALFGYSIPLRAVTAGGVAADHCCTDIATAFGNNVTDSGSNLFSKSAASQFVSVTSDFHLKIGAACIDAGVADTTDIPSSDDIVGITRPQGSAWDIGAAEYNGGTSSPAIVGVAGTSAAGATIPGPMGKPTGVAATGNAAVLTPSGVLRGTAATGGVGALTVLSQGSPHLIGVAAAASAHATGFSVSTTNASTVKFLAGSLTGNAGTAEPNNGAALKSALAIDTVFIPVEARTTNATSTDATWQNSFNDPTIAGGTIETWVQTYKAAGVKVILAMYLDPNDGTPRQNIAPSNCVTFLGNVQARAVELAQCAQRTNADAISITPELFPSQGGTDYPARYMPQWRNIYAACKNAFSGPVLYQSLCGTAGPVGSNNAMDWTNCWDAIGVDLYPPAQSTSTTASAIQHDWETIVDSEGSAGFNTPVWGANSWVRKLYQAWGSSRKIWIGECGCLAFTGAQTAPADYSRTGPLDTGIQNAFWTAMCNEITNNVDLLYGIDIWVADPQGTGGLPGGDYGVLNTPSQTTIQTAFAAIQGVTPTQTAGAAVTGVSAVGAAGNATTQHAGSTALSGTAAASAAGTLRQGASGAAPGVAAQTQAGSVSLTFTQSTSSPLAVPSAATGIAAPVALQITGTPSLSGVSVTGFAAAARSSPAVALVGNAAAGQPGSISSPRSLLAASVAASGVAGVVAPQSSRTQAIVGVAAGTATGLPTERSNPGVPGIAALASLGGAVAQPAILGHTVAVLGTAGRIGQSAGASVPLSGAPAAGMAVALGVTAGTGRTIALFGVAAIGASAPLAVTAGIGGTAQPVGAVATGTAGASLLALAAHMSGTTALAGIGGVAVRLDRSASASGASATGHASSPVPVVAIGLAGASGSGQAARVIIPAAPPGVVGISVAAGLLTSTAAQSVLASVSVPGHAGTVLSASSEALTGLAAQSAVGAVVPVPLQISYLPQVAANGRANGPMPMAAEMIAGVGATGTSGRVGIDPGSLLAGTLARGLVGFEGFAATRAISGAAANGLAGTGGSAGGGGGGLPVGVEVEALAATILSAFRPRSVGVAGMLTVRNNTSFGSPDLIG